VLKPWTRYKVSLNGSPDSRTLSSLPTPSCFESHSISLQRPFLSRGAGRARARCVHALPKSIGIFLPADNHVSARPPDESSHMSFARRSSGQGPTLPILNEKSRGSLTFEFVALSDYDRSILFRETATKRKRDSKKISSQMVKIVGRRLQTACHIRVGETRNFFVFHSRNLISESRNFIRDLNKYIFCLNVKNNSSNDVKRIL